MIVYYILHIFILIAQFIYGQNTTTDKECKPVNNLLGIDQERNCCIQEGIICQNGHVTEM